MLRLFALSTAFEAPSRANNCEHASIEFKRWGTRLGTMPRPPAQYGRSDTFPQRSGALLRCGMRRAARHEAAP
jgi:hypothetical protein